jgi:hypothetical protein
VLSIEGSELGGVIRGETAGSGILRIVEPETQVEGVGRWQGRVRIEAEDLVEQDRLDPYMAVVGVLPNLDVRLIPRKAEAPCEVRIGRLVRQERAPLHREQIEGQAGLEPVQIKDQRVVELAANHRRPGPGLFIRRLTKTIDKLRVSHKIKTDLILASVPRTDPLTGNLSISGNAREDRSWFRSTILMLGLIAIVVLAALGYRAYRNKSNPRQLSQVPRRLAVLPFQNLQENVNTDFLGFSLADAIITKLGYVSELTVRPPMLFRNIGLRQSIFRKLPRT